MTTEVKDLISKSLLTGAINSLGSMLIFAGSDIIDFKIPFMGTVSIPDSVALFSSAAVGQLVSDLVHDGVYKSIPLSGKMRQANSALASIAAYNIAQLPFLWAGSMPMKNVAQYLLLSSTSHYAGESIYHDILSKKSGGIII